MVVYDGISYSNEATVFINIIELQRPPTTENIIAKVKHRKVLQLQLLGQDDDGDSFVFLINENPKNGQLNLVGDKITYRPKPGFVGSDRFTYRAKDEKGDYSNISTVSINVYNSKPVAVKEIYTVKAGKSVRIILKASDNDPEDKASLAYVLQKRPRYGTFERYESSSGLSPNIYTYTPFKDFSGPDQLVFYANDGAQNSSPVIIDINVTEDSSSSPVVTSKTSKPEFRTKKQILKYIIRYLQCWWLTRSQNFVYFGKCFLFTVIFVNK